MRKFRVSFCALCLFLLSGAGLVVAQEQPPQNSPTAVQAPSTRVDTIGREYLLIRVDAEGFNKLSARDQALAYCLFRAGLPGRETFFYLNHRHAPGIKTVLVLCPMIN